MSQVRTLSVTNNSTYTQTYLVIQELKNARVSLPMQLGLGLRELVRLCLCALLLLFSLLVLLPETCSMSGVPRCLPDVCRSAKSTCDT